MEFLAFLDVGTVFWVFVGAFIGWNLPQPLWAQIVFAKIKELYVKLKEKIVGIFVRK